MEGASSKAILAFWVDCHPDWLVIEVVSATV